MLLNFVKTRVLVIRPRLVKIKRRVTNASVVTGLKGKIVNLMWMSVRIMFAALEVVVRILLERTSVFVKKTTSVTVATTTDQKSRHLDPKQTVTPIPTAKTETSTQNAHPQENAIARPDSPENCAIIANQATPETCATKT